MNASKNEISTLFSILSIKFPTEYPKKDSIDELDSFLPAINFPTYSESDINSFSSNFQAKNTFKDIIENIHFYFPFVPNILKIISKYKQDTTNEILDICACIVMCSYISWRSFCEYTKNFEHLHFLLDCIPLASKSNYTNIITDVYCDSLNFYLEQCPSFDFKTIFNSMSMLLKNESIGTLSKMQTIFYKIISNKFLTSNNSEISDDCQTFISYLCELTDIFPDIFESKTAKEIVLLLSNHIENIEINSLHLFSNFYQKIEKEVTIPIFSIFPVSFYKHITSTQPPFEFPEKQDKQSYTDFFSIQFSIDPKKNLKFEDFSDFSFIEGTFSEEFQKRPIFSFERKYPNGILLNEETRKILVYIARAAQTSEECRDIIIKDFNSFIVQKENKYRNILLYSLIFIISNLSLNSKQAKAYWNILLASDLFNNDFLAFDLESPNKIIDQMRNEALDSMILSGFLDVHIFLSNLSKNQLLLSETFHRLFRCFSDISKIEFLSTDFLYFLIQYCQYFQKLNISEKNQKSIQIIESTRICLLLLISQGLTIDEVSIFWFSIPFFANFFSSLIFENSLRCYVLENYKQYLINFFHQNDQTFISSIKKLFLIFFQTEKIQIEKSLLISIDFVNMLNSILSEKVEYIVLTDIIIESLMNIDYTSDESHIYFIQVLQMMSFVHLNEKHYSILRESIKKLNKEKFGQQIKNELFKLASGNQCLSEIIPLQQPKIISIILEYLENKNENMMKYLSNEIQPLLSKSIYNCRQALDNGIEEILIEKLKGLQKENPLNVTFASQILNILTSIYSIKASFNSSLHFIEFISPIDTKHVSALSPYLLQSLTTLFNNYSKTPHSYLSFTSKIDILNVDSITFCKSFDLAFWCFFEPYQTKSNSIHVCSILDSKEKGIRISIKDDKKIVIDHLRKHKETLEFDVNFPTGKWHLVKIKFAFDQISNLSRHSSQSSIEAFSIRSASSFGRMKNGSKSFNNSDYTPLSMFSSAQVQAPSFSPSSSNIGLNANQSFSPLKKTPLSFNFSLSPTNSTLFPYFIDFQSCGSKAKQSNPNFSAIVSVNIDGNETDAKDLSLRRFIDQTVSVKIGSTAEILPKSYFSCFSVFPHNLNDESNFFSWDNESSQIVSTEDPLLTVTFQNEEGVIRPICETKDVSIDKECQVSSSLAEIFIQKAKIHSLILLFAEFDFLTYEEIKVPAFADFTVEMIVAVIQCGKSAQTSFYASKCPEAISHLLSLCDPSNLNFSIYLQITALLNLIVVPKLKQKFLSLIVLNPDIWGRAESEVFRLITQHWSHNLFSVYQNQMKKIMTVPFLLYIVSEYYQNEKILNNICNLFLKIIEIEFTSQDFLNIIECSTSKSETKLVNSYLEVLKRTLSSRKESDSVISQNIQLISLLHNLLELNDDTIFCSVIEIIMICHRKNFIKSKSLTLLQHVRIIMNKITPGVCTMASLRAIIQMTNTTNPDLYPLYCLIALNCGKDAIEFLVETIKPSKFLVSSFERLIWILILLCSIENVEKQKTFCFLFNNIFPKIKETCILVQLISIACVRIPDQQLNAFLNLEFNLISEHPENFQADFVHKILKIAYNAILFSPKPSVSRWIQKVTENSPFNDQTEKMHRKSSLKNDVNQNDHFLRPFDIYQKIEEISNSSRKIAFQFCPRLDENGNWLDSSLSLQCLKLFELYFKPSLLNYDLILCAFIFRINPALARTHLQRINISNYSSKIQSNLLSFIFYSGERKGIDLTNILPSKQTFSKLASFSFLQEFSEQTKSDTFGSEMAKTASEISSWNDQNMKIEKNFTTFSNTNYETMKEMNLCITNEIKYNIMKRRFMILHVWQQMWNEMCRYKGRWSCAKNAAMVRNHFKRSSRLIFDDISSTYYPLKMTLNNEFYNDHIDASIARDIESLNESPSEYECFRKQKKLYGIVFSTLRPSISNADSNYYERISSSSSFAYGKYINSNPAFRKEAVLVKPKGQFKIIFEVFFDAFVINKKPIFFTDIREIALRRRMHRPTAFEIFKKDGKSYLIDIPHYNNANLKKYFLPFMTTITISEYTEKWIKYEISTFEYLMKLNEFSSRTFNDLSAYPIMPWIIADYKSERLDLEDPKTFRDLSKPIRSIDEEQAHFFSGCYNSPSTVLSCLVRIEPFTTIHINRNNGKFESTAKIFKSIQSAYENAARNGSESCELIPEFFTTPEFLVNKENFDLTGSSSIDIQCSSSSFDSPSLIDQITSETSKTAKPKFPGYVNLPPWAMNTSIFFVYMNRKALESDHVSASIHKWIDLVWGFKQGGREAEKANNTFCPLMYGDIWARLDKGEIRSSPEKVENVLSEVGQIPIQLFNNPHPSREKQAGKGSRTHMHSKMKNEETIMFGINQIFLSSFAAVKNDDYFPQNLNVTTNNNTKVPKQRDVCVSGLVIDSCSKIISLNIRGNSVTTVFNDTIEKQFKFDHDNFHCITSSLFLYLSSDRHSFKIYKPFEKSTIKSGSVNYRISRVCIDDDVIATCGENSATIWSAKDVTKACFTLPTYREDIACIQVSVAFDLLVCGTKDGFIQFNSINDRRSIQIVEIGDFVAETIKITQSWGFVIVYATSRSKSSSLFILFSPNGNKIRQTEIPRGEELTAIETYRSSDGFDFAFAATDSGSIFHFEVFFSKFENPFYSSPFRVNCMSYVSEQNALYCTGNDNSILVVPFYA